MTDRELAVIACRDFAGTKRVLLRDHSREKFTMSQVVQRLRRRYEVLTRQHLREGGTTYDTWLTHGPKGELDEVLEATRDPAVWDRLVETYEKRFERFERSECRD